MLFRSKKVIDTVDIPVSVKLSYYFSDLGAMIKDLSEIGLAGITLFNRFYNIDIDIEKRQLQPAKVLSHPFEYQKSLRWIGITSGRVNCELAASTGVHDHLTAIKMIMAGASAVQIVSGVYKYGYKFVQEMADGLNNWMDSHNVKTIDEIKGVANMQKVKNPAEYERVQFMKYFGGYDQDID